uniref:Uncharacterized protein n=1 Tax=Meloidogyne enterolobii TaxID=390850 RepID=A0A6V7UQE7_MELEN|nr:unnamed protein product [Meloidogyne enterolobii]
MDTGTGYKPDTGTNGYQGPNTGTSQDTGTGDNRILGPVRIPGDRILGTNGYRDRLIPDTGANGYSGPYRGPDMIPGTGHNRILGPIPFMKINLILKIFSKLEIIVLIEFYKWLLSTLWRCFS